MVEAALVALREYGTKSFAEAVQPAIELADGFPLDELRVILARQQRQVPGGVADFEAASSCRTAALPQPGEIFRQPDLARTLRAMADGREEGAGRRAPAARRRSTPCAITSIAARSRTRSTSSRRRTAGCCATRTWPRSTLRAGGAGLHHVPRLHGLQAGLLEPGPDDDRDAEHSGRLQPAGAEAELRGLHPHAGGSAEAGLRRSRHVLRRSQVREDSGRAPALEGVRRRAAQADHERGVARFPPRQRSEPNPPKHPYYSNIARYKIDDALLAKDTTCVDAIDKDGVAISITPSGAWLPSVIAGDTGIPLTRARAELPAGARASQRARRRQAAARDAEPDAGDVGPNNTLLTLSTPGGDVQEQSLLQVLLYATRVGHERASRRWRRRASRPSTWSRASTITR